MKLSIFKNGINLCNRGYVLHPKYSLHGNMSRYFKMVPFCSLCCIEILCYKIYIVR